MAVHRYGDGLYVAVGGMSKIKPARRHQAVTISLDIFALSPLHRFLGALLAVYCVIAVLGSRDSS